MTVDRKLVAVVMADVVGYSRLMERDETGTHARTRELRDLIVPKATALGGRLVKTIGDGFLFEFSSATAALRWAIDVQRELAARNAGVADDAKLQLRIGINLGDIIVEGDDIIGDGVNVAARLESIAEPGGICIAAAVSEQVHEDLGVAFVDAGEQYVKNISNPVHVYHVSFGERAFGDAWPRQRPAWRAWLARRRGPVAAVAALALLAVGAVLMSGRDAPADAESSTLSIRVTRFASPSGDARLAGLADALAADLARAMGDTMRDARVQRDGDARYEVEGEVRSSGADIDVALRLLAGADRKQLDHDRTSMALADVETNRERLVARVLSATRELIDGAETKRVLALKRPPSSPRELVAKANWILEQSNIDSVRQARRLYDDALRRDPSFMPALIGRANTYVEEYRLDYMIENALLIAPLDRDTLAAVTLDPRDPDAWNIRSSALMLQGRFDAALDANDRARSIDPTRYRGQRSMLLLMTGRAEEVAKTVEERTALLGRVDPGFRFLLCHSYLLLGRYADAIRECELAVVSDDNYWIWIDLAAAYGQTGVLDKAVKAKDELLRRVPEFTLSRLDRKRMSKDPTYVGAVREHLYPGLRKAGVPE